MPKFIRLDCKKKRKYKTTKLCNLKMHFGCMQNLVFKNIFTPKIHLYKWPKLYEKYMK